MKYSISLGDVSKVIYGGFLVYEPTGDAIYWDEPQFDCFDNPEKGIECYRFTIEDNTITDLSWIKLDDWKAIANTMDMADIVELGTSSDIFDRARVYEAVGLYYGFNNFNEYPERYTYNELVKMYPDK